MRIKAVKNSKENEYPIDSEISQEDKRLKKPLKRWVKIGIGLIVLITLLTTGVYLYVQETTIYSGGSQGIVDASIQITNSTVRQYAGKRVKGGTVKEFIAYINVLNENQTFPIDLVMYYEDYLYCTEKEFQELKEKIIDNEYYELKAVDNKPLSTTDGYYDLIYVEKINKVGNNL